MTTMKHPVSKMVCTSIRSHGVGHFVVLEGNINAAKHQKALLMAQLTPTIE